MAMAFGGGCSCGGESCSGERSGGRDRGGQPNGRSLHGIGGDHGDESTGAGGGTVFGEVFAQAFNGAADAPLGRVLADAERLRHLAGGLALEVAEQHGVAIRLAQLPQRGVELRGDLFPGGVGFAGKQFVHDGGLLFAGAAAFDAAHGLRRDVLGGPVQPAGNHGTMAELTGAFRKREEYALGHVLGQMRIAHHSQRRRIDKINMAAHQFGKGRFRAVFRVGSQQM
jgi:hypothetical protein